MAIRKEFTLEELYFNGFSEREVAIMDYILLAGTDDVGRCAACFRRGQSLTIDGVPTPSVLTEKCLQLLIDVGLVHDTHERGNDGTNHVSIHGDHYLTIKGRTFSCLGGMRHYITEMNKDREENERARAASIEAVEYSKRANVISVVSAAVSAVSVLIVILTSVF
ncbi:MAG: hypothetical protein GC178_05435 [Flavobacteriales bacterium]|nr:hypothetical protein [Flavobacteriales bacterium]